jgi:hypothetical protein
VWPDTQYSWTALLFTVALMPVAAAVGTGFNGLIRRAQPKSPPASWTLLVTIGLAGLLTGACSIWMPQMPGNGKSIIVESLAGGDTLIAVTVAMVLKPVLTALFIRAGAVGGMLTPSLATGVATGASIALLVERLGGYASVPTLALIGGAAVLGITQRAPVFATVFTAELTHPPPPIWGMLLLAAVGAHWVRLLAARRRRPAKPDRAPPHFKHCQHRLAWHDVAIGRRIVLAGSVAGTVAAVAAAMAVGIAPIAAAAPSEQHCLEQHCLAAEAPTIRQGPANVQIVTSPKAMPAVFPHTNNPKWRGLGYNARWPTLGHNPKWQDFGYSPRWNGFQTALLPDPGMGLPEVEGPRPLPMRNNNQ